MTNIIQFPTGGKETDVIKSANAKSENEQQLINDIELFADEVVAELVAMMYEVAYDVGHEDYVYDISIVYESIRSLLYRMNTLDHPMQHFAQKIYEDENAAKYINDAQYEFDF